MRFEIFVSMKFMVEIPWDVKGIIKIARLLF